MREDRIDIDTIESMAGVFEDLSEAIKAYRSARERLAHGLGDKHEVAIARNRAMAIARKLSMMYGGEPAGWWISAEVSKQ
jgi:hypothetical protein